MRTIVIGLVTLMVCLAARPAAAEMLHRWSFDSDASDSVGDADGKLMEGATVGEGRVNLDGVGGYVALPIGGTIEKLSNATIETWATWDEFLDPWARIFDFGQGANASMFVTTRNGRAEQGSNADMPRFVITSSGFENEEQLNAPERFPIGKDTHVAVTIDAEKGVAKLYINGKLAATKEGMTLKPADLGNTSNNWLGASQYTETDPFFAGSITEFRIYNTALSEDEIKASFERGPDKVEP